MKILHNVHTWLPLTQRWMHTQIKYIPDGLESHIVCQKTINRNYFSDIGTIHCMEDSSSIVNYFFKRFLRFMRIKRGLGWIKIALNNFRPDLIHSHFGHIGWIALPEIKNYAPHIVTFYGFDVSMLPKKRVEWRARYKELFLKVEGVLCEGEHMAACVRDLGCDPSKIYVHHLGIMVDQIPYCPRIWEQNKPLKILLAGTFTEKKGFPYAIAALGRLAKQIPIEVTIIGDSDQSKYGHIEKQKIFKSVNDSGILSKINFLGYCSFETLLKNAFKNQIFLSPSITAETGDTEGGAPITMIEMAASGMPIVSTKHCDIPAVIIHRNTGLLSPERDIDGIYQNLLWLVENQKKWRPMLDRSRKHIESNFNARIQGIRLAQIYRNIARF